MRYRPRDITDDQVRRALADGWGFRAATLDYAAVGGGSYNWIAANAAGRRRFVKVDDLDSKPWLGSTRAEVLTGLRQVMDAAAALRDQGLAFVVAPLAGITTDTVVQLADDRYTVTTFPYLHGSTGRWGDPVTDADRFDTLGMLHVLHQAAVPVPETPIDLPGRAALEAALAGLARPWSGPYAEDTRRLLSGHETRIRSLLELYDELAEAVKRLPKVLTHGEPHPGNIMRADGRLLLLDWDTAGLAPAERDLWLLTPEPDTEGAAFYRLRWALTDVALFAADLHQARHVGDAARQVWTYLQTSVRRIS